MKTIKATKTPERTKQKNPTPKGVLRSAVSSVKDKKERPGKVPKKEENRNAHQIVVWSSTRFDWIDGGKMEKRNHSESVLSGGSSQQRLISESASENDD